MIRLMRKSLKNKLSEGIWRTLDIRPMKNLTIIAILLTCLVGCATTDFIKNVHIGMTKKQVITACGSPTTWNRQTINGKTYESLNYNPFLGNFDFVDGILVGYSRRDAFGNLKYYSSTEIEKSI
jgi:hypothetical protein